MMRGQVTQTVAVSGNRKKAEKLKRRIIREVNNKIKYKQLMKYFI
jgi:hypothetical protein